MKTKCGSHTQKLLSELLQLLNSCLLNKKLLSPEVMSVLQSPASCLLKFNTSFSVEMENEKHRQVGCLYKNTR